MPAVPSARSERPHLFLDVDGVLNAFELSLSSEAEPFDDFDAHEVEFEFEMGHPRTFVVCLSRAMGARLARLPVDIQWVTTWEHRADSAIAPLCGLPSGLPVLTPRDEAESWDLDWKLIEVRRAVERDPRPFVWIDDDVDFFHDGAASAREWAESLPLPSLLIAPEGETGLLPLQLDTVEDFVRRHGAEFEDHETGEP